MSEETEAQQENAADKDENDETTVDKKEKLQRVADKLKAMGMMPGDAGGEDKPVKNHKGKMLLAGIAVSAVVIAGLSYAFIKRQDMVEVGAAQNTVPVEKYSVSHEPMAARNQVVWPRPMSENQVKTLREARNLYWQHDYQKAEEQYALMLDDVKDQPDLYGELGNVQFFAGNRNAAIESYVQAASLLIEQNRFAEVGPAVSVVARFDLVRANELMEKMANRNSAQ